jgi:HK97 family phage prohead protease
VSLRLAGYAALFDLADGDGDVIRKGAFARAISASRTRPLPLFWQHRPEQRIGAVELLQEDARGLAVIARIDNPQGRAALALARREANGLSFGYRARAFRPIPGGRLLEDVELIEISLVTHPLQLGARVHLVQ